IIVMAGFVGTAVLMIRPILEWTGKPTFAEHLSLFFWTLASVCIYGLDMIANYGLYAYKLDRVIAMGRVASLMTFLGVMIFVPASFGEAAVPMSLCLAYTVMLVVKGYGLGHLRGREI